jgi:hypothetical protein
MSASKTSMYDFINALCIRVPPDIHPSARWNIDHDFSEMREAVAVDDHAHVVLLMAYVRDRVVDELRWEAEKYRTVRKYREAYRLRRRADRFEVAHA